MGIQGKRLSDEKIKIIIDAKNEGTGTDDIAYALGVSKYVVNKYWKEYKNGRI